MNVKLTILVSALLLSAAPPGRAERVTPAEAKAAAQGWVRMIERVKGHWGTAVSPEIGQVVALQVSNRVVGYYCPVPSGGYVVVSSHKELEPVRAYSVRGGLNPTHTRGPSALVRGMLDGVVSGLEQRIGPLDTAKPEQVQALLKRDYRPAWKMLHEAAAKPSGINPEDGGGGGAGGGGGVLLSDMWHQTCPYNWYCPSGNCDLGAKDYHCSDSACGASSGNKVVGCVPLSGSQIMRHWCWPPPGLGPNNHVYSWASMPNTLGCSSSTDQIFATARLCRDVGDVMTTLYGCDGTGADLYRALSPGWTTMEENYQGNFFFDVDYGNDRHGIWPHPDYTDDEWWNGIVAELNNKQPVHYQMDVYIDGKSDSHTFVVDGWGVAPGTNHMVHVNYGWGEKSHEDTVTHESETVLGWLSLDHLSFSAGNEGRLFNVVPHNHIGATVSGSYGTVGPAGGFDFYFNQDASGSSAEFLSPSWSQFLPTVKVAHSGSSGDIRFIGWHGGFPTRLCANGDSSKGIRINQGLLKLVGRGCLRLVPQVPPRYPCAQWNSGFVRVSWDRGYSDDETTVIERSNDEASWAVAGTVDAAVTYYDDYSPGWYYRLRSSARGCLSSPSDVAVAQ